MVYKNVSNSSIKGNVDIETNKSTKALRDRWQPQPIPSISGALSKAPDLYIFTQVKNRLFIIFMSTPSKY